MRAQALFASLAETRTHFFPSHRVPRRFPVKAWGLSRLGPPPNSPLCCVHWHRRAPHGLGGCGGPSGLLVGDQPPGACGGSPRARRLGQKATVLHCVPLQTCQPWKRRVGGGNSQLSSWIESHTAPRSWRPHHHTAVQIGEARVTLGSWRGLGGAEGSVLPARPGSQSRVSSAALGLGLGPPSGSRGCPVVWRLRGVSMEVDHPGR